MEEEVQEDCENGGLGCCFDKFDSDEAPVDVPIWEECTCDQSTGNHCNG